MENGVFRVQIYTKEYEQMRYFYGTVLGLPVLVCRETGRDDRVCVYGAASGQIEVIYAPPGMEASAFALGCPAMGAEVLEEGEMEPFVTEVEAFAAGKKIGLFGSYGWGDGQWMRDWEDRMKAAGATVVGGEGVICQETPDDDALANCKALGKELAALA